MIWEVIKILFWVFLAFCIFKMAMMYKQQRQLESYGVVFNPYFAPISDPIRMIYYMSKYPQEVVFTKMIELG